MIDNQAENKGLRSYLHKKLAISNWSTTTMILLLLPVAVIISLVVAKAGIIGAAGLLVLIIGVPVVYGVIAYPEFGIAVFVVVSFMLNYVSEFLPPDAPSGILLDALTYLLIFGFFVKKKYDNNWDYFKNPISYLVLIWLKVLILLYGSLIEDPACKFRVKVFQISDIIFLRFKNTFIRFKNCNHFIGK